MISQIKWEVCNGCGVCVDVCPMDVLRIDEAMQKAVVRYYESCMTCYNCEMECPLDCISVSPFRKSIPPLIAYPEREVAHD